MRWREDRGKRCAAIPWKPVLCVLDRAAFPRMVVATRRPGAAAPGSPLNGTSPARGRGSSAARGRTGAVAGRSGQGPVPAPGGRKREGPSPGWAETASAGSGRQSRLGTGPKGRALPQVRHRRHGPLHDRADDCAWTTGRRLDLREDRDHGLQRLREGGDGLGPAPGTWPRATPARSPARARSAACRARSRMRFWA